MGFSGVGFGFAPPPTTVPPVSDIQINVTDVVDGTAAKVLIVNGDGTLGQIAASSLAISITIDSTAVNSGTASAILFTNAAGGTLGDDPNFLYISSGGVNAVDLYGASSTPTNAGSYAILKARAGTTALVNGDRIGTFTGIGYDGATYQSNGVVQMVVDGVVSAGNVPTAIEFVTSLTNSAGATCKMFVGSDGYVGVGWGASSASVGALVDIKLQGSADTDLGLRLRNSADNADILAVQGDTIIRISSVNGMIQAGTGTSERLTLNKDNSGTSELKGSVSVQLTANSDLTDYVQGNSFIFRNLAAYNTSDYTFISQIGQTGGLCEFILTHTGASRNVLTIGIGGASALPAAAADMFKVYAADISAGNTALHTIAEAGQIYYMGSMFGLKSNHNLSMATNDTEQLVLTTDGRLYGKSLHNNAGAVTGTTNQYIASGTYTPTLTNVTNVAASTEYSCQWTRVGNVVTVSGKVDIDVTATVATELGISLPIASNFTLDANLGGVAASAAAASLSAMIKADTTNDRASLNFIATSVTNDSYAFSFTYLIL